MHTIAFLSSINEYSVGEFIAKFQEAKDYGENEVLVRVNTPGGNVAMGWSWLMTMKDFLAENDSNKIIYRAEGMVASMGAFATLYVSEATAIDKTRFTFHRAAYPSWVNVSEAMQKELDDINAELRSAMESKIDKSKWKQITGVSIREMFDGSKDRIDVTINAKDAKRLGIVKKVINLSSIEAQKINAELIAAHLEPIEIEAQHQETENENEIKTMTAQEIKEKYPEAYNAIVKQGESQERDRVEAWMAFKDIDAEKVHKGIESGELLNQKAMAEFQVAGIKKGFVVNAANENGANADTTGKEGAEDTTGTDTVEAEKKARIDAFEKELDSTLEKVSL